MIRAIRQRFFTKRIIALLIYCVHVSSRPALAQVDPLLYLKTQTPNITLLVDTTSRMQRDADETYYDPQQYTKTGAAWEATIGVNATTTTSKYYRKFVALNPPLSLLGIPLDGLLYKAQRIDTVGDRQAGFATHLERTRIEIARRGVLEAIDGSMYAVRFNLLRMGQLVGASSFETRGTVYVTDASQRPPSGPAEIPATTLLGIPLTSPGYKITRNTNLVSGASAMSLLGPLLPSDAIGGNTLIRNQIATATGTTGALVPLGLGDLGQVLAPVATLLTEVIDELIRLLTGRPVCENGAVIMVVGGGEPALSLTAILTLVTQLLSLILGHRVPIHVIALAPSTDTSFLQTLTDLTGGRYTEVTKAQIDVTVPGQPVPELVNALNWAIQHSLLPPADYNKNFSALTAAQLRALSVEHQSTSPITGTVNLKGRTDINGTALPDTEVFHAGEVVKQKSNVMVTSGYTQPGMEGKLRAFRAYKPEANASKPNGYDFVQDGTRLWTAAIPAAASRNIFTVLPNGTMTALTAANAAVLAPYLGPVNAADLIGRIRSQPLGAIVGSTPAIMDPPSLEPGPDVDYGFFKDLNRDRHSLVFVGATDGMMHAFDARTGLEVWAFIPFNLLPKLRTVPWGLGMDAGFRAMVDSSPKLSDVKINGQWRTYLLFGEGGGGTFYNALDVTLHRMGETVGPTVDTASALLTYFSSTTRMPWVWSFPRLTSFDATIVPYGDVSAGASAIEKTVGETWSDPAIAPMGNDNNDYAVFVGSGYLPYATQQQANRGGAVAGTTFYVLSARTGTVLASRDVGNDSLGETDNSCRAAGNCMRSKNALQMDPSLVGSSPSNRTIDKIYIGDLDGRVWRMNFSLTSAGAAQLATPAKLYDAGAANPLYSSMATASLNSAQTYLFFGTGSDLLPSTGVSQAYSLMRLLDGGGTATALTLQTLARTDNAGEDQKVTGFPAAAGGVVFFTTNTYVTTTPCTPINTNTYAFAYGGGPAYDTNGGGFTATGAGADSTQIFARSNVRGTAPFIVDRHLAIGVGTQVELFGDERDFNNTVGQAGVRLLSWREVR